VPIDPEMAAFVERAADIFDATFDRLPLAEQRRLYGEFCRRFDGPRPADIEAHDRTLKGPAGAIPVRVYRPRGAGSLPAVIYLHGGGWVFGNPDTMSRSLRRWPPAFRRRWSASTIGWRPSIAFRPPSTTATPRSNRFSPAAADLGVDRRRIAVAGDSAGANLSAAVALAARDRGGPPLSGQALLYGVFSTDFDRPSCWEHAEAPFLTRASMFDYVGAYLGGRSPATIPTSRRWRLPRMPICRRPSSPPPASNPLRDDSAAYAARLNEAGVAVEHRCAPDLIHGYLRAIGSCRAAAAEFDALCAWLARRLTVAS